MSYPLSSTGHPLLLEHIVSFSARSLPSPAAANASCMKTFVPLTLRYSPLSNQLETRGHCSIFEIRGRQPPSLRLGGELVSLSRRPIPLADFGADSGSHVIPETPPSSDTETVPLIVKQDNSKTDVLEVGRWTVHSQSPQDPMHASFVPDLLAASSETLASLERQRAPR